VKAQNFKSRGLRNHQKGTKPPIGMEPINTPNETPTTQRKLPIVDKPGDTVKGADFRRLRKQRKLTQQWVAQRCGCSASLISKWEKGQCLLSAHVNSLLREVSTEIVAMGPVSSSKTCWMCTEVLPQEMFGQDNARTCGIQSKCRLCNAETVRKWREDNPQRIRDKRMMLRKAKSASKRQAGHRWMKTDTRSFGELVLLGDRGDLHLTGKQKRITPKKKDSQRGEQPQWELRERVVLVGAANEMLRVNKTIDSPDGEICEAWIDRTGRLLKNLFDSGQINENQTRRLVSLAANRRPLSFLE
jgi:DNA-binding transcriptional regulator YiaG